MDCKFHPAFGVKMRDPRDVATVDTTSAREPAPPRFAFGALLRYSSGPTAIFRVSYVSVNHAGPGAHRYYGQHCLGGPHAAYETECTAATKADHREWKLVRKRYDVAPFDAFAAKGPTIVGAVED